MREHWRTAGAWRLRGAAGLAVLGLSRRERSANADMTAGTGFSNFTLSLLALDCLLFLLVAVLIGGPFAASGRVLAG